MRIVLDTNVFISGLFFSGIPGKILDSWRQRRITFVVSPELILEYIRVVDELSQQFPDISISGDLELLNCQCENYLVFQPLEQISRDRDDDIFLALALQAKVDFLVTGDKDLLELKDFKDIVILSPREFYDQYKRIVD